MRRVLAVSSDLDFMETIGKALDSSFELICASTEKEGLDKAREENPDLILLGYLEPRGVSFQLHKKLRDGLNQYHSSRGSRCAPT